MYITKNLSGTLTICDIIKGELVKEQYQGYKIAEAKKQFLMKHKPFKN
jgi:hypothetical protein